MKTGVEVQVDEAADIDPDAVPSVEQLRAWAEATLDVEAGEGSVCVRILGETEGRALNAEFRGIERATNVLAFPLSSPLAPEQGILGDIAICAPVVCREATENGAPERHWAHMVVHGVLHLLGHDHQEPTEAMRMESREQMILTKLGYPGDSRV